MGRVVICPSLGARCRQAAPALLPSSTPSAPQQHPFCSLAASILLPSSTRSAPRQHPLCSPAAPALLPGSTRSAPRQHPFCSPAAPILLPGSTRSAPQQHPAGSGSENAVGSEGPPLLPVAGEEEHPHACPDSSSRSHRLWRCSVITFNA